jgi:hypothetical protein
VSHPPPYLGLALDQTWRLVSMVDRNPLSTTRGSFSRTHWAWKFSDFPYPRLQEGVYALCRLFETNAPENALAGAPALERSIVAGFEYWASRQHANGAFDEAYPNEQCLAATAFTGFYLGSAYLRIRERIDRVSRERLEATFARAGAWLCANDETHGILSNHLAVAGVALEVLARICGREEFSKRAMHFRDRILAHQSADGWLLEYDGADIGYGTHGFFYLAVYWQLTACGRTLDALRRFAAFLAYFVHPDGTLGGEYGSRNTEFCYPAGFEIMASVCGASASIASALRESLADRHACGVSSMDEFNLMPMLNNLWFAHDAAGAIDAAAPLPWRGAPFRRRFDDAGLWVANEARYYAILGLSKGGTVSVFDKASRRLTARHGGLVAHGDGRLWTSQDYTRPPNADWSDAGDAVTIEIPWKRLGVPVFTGATFLAFRVFSLTAGRVPAISRWLKALLVRVLIHRRVRPPVRHIRRLSLAEEGVAIDDRLELPRHWLQVDAIEQFTAVHMGSSMYADVRIASDLAAATSWKSGGTMRLHGRLTMSGQTWTRGEA